MPLFNILSDIPNLMLPPKYKVLNLLSFPQTAETYDSLFRATVSKRSVIQLKVFDIVNVQAFESMSITDMPQQGSGPIGIYSISSSRKLLPLRTCYTTYKGGPLDISGTDYICFVPLEGYEANISVENTFCKAMFV